MTTTACLPRCAQDHETEGVAEDGSERCQIHARASAMAGGAPVAPRGERTIAADGATAARRVWLGVGELHMSVGDARSYALELLRMVGDLTADEVATGIPTAAAEASHAERVAC